MVRMPALLTKMSRVPKASAALATAARSSSADPLSAFKDSALPPADSISRSSWRACSSEREHVKATDAPSAASRRTMPAPMPLEPPVTRATLPLNDFACMCHQILLVPKMPILDYLVKNPLNWPLCSFWITLSRIAVQRDSFAGCPTRFAWNICGMADLVNAVVLGTLTGRGPGGIVFPLVLIPVYGVPRGFLIHSYSLIGLLRKTSQQPRHADSLHYGMDTARA